MHPYHLFIDPRCYAQRRLSRWVLLRMGNAADEALWMAMAAAGSNSLMMLRKRDRATPYVTILNRRSWFVCVLRIVLQ